MKFPQRTADLRHTKRVAELKRILVKAANLQHRVIYQSTLQALADGHMHDVV